MIIYRNIDGVKTILHNIEVDSNTELQQKIAGQDVILARFTVADEMLDLRIGDYVEFKNSVYTILDEPQVKKSQNHFFYNLQFKGDQYILKNVQLFNPGTDETEFFLFGDAIDMISLIIHNLNRVYGHTGEYYADYVEQTEGKNVGFSNENCLAALQKLSAEFDCEYRVEGKKITFRKKIGTETGLTFRYKKEVREIERQLISNAEVITVLYAKGSERNITNEYGSTRLKIPKIEKNREIFGTIERTVVFDDIYPRLNGSVSSVNGSLKFTDTSIDFNINSQLIGGLKAKVIFNTGDLAGREFEIFKYNSSAKEIELVQHTDESNLTLPNEVLKPRVGDKYVLVNIKMPQSYIDKAEEELLERATEYLDKYSQPNVIYRISPHYPELRRKQKHLNLGDIITIVDEDFGIELPTRILALTQKLNNEFEYSLEIGSQIAVSYLTQALNDNKNLRNNIYQNNKYVTDLINRYFTNIREFTAPLYVNRGEFNPANFYYNNQNRRDYVFRWEGEPQSLKKTWYFYIGEDHQRAEWIQANWQLIGDQFEILATETLLAQNANIGNWFIQNGQIVSQKEGWEGEPNVQMNGLAGFLKFVSGIDIWGAGRYHRYKQVINIGGTEDGLTAHRAGDAYQEPAYVEFSSNGVYADFAGHNTMTDSDQPQGHGAIVGIGNAKNSVGDFVAGVVGWAKKIAGSVPSFGGVFWGLKSYGRYYNVKVLGKTFTTYSVADSDEVLSCYNTGTLKIYLPQPNATPPGRVIRVRRVNSEVQVHGKLMADNQRSFERIKDGDMWTCINDGGYWLINFMGRTD